MTGTRSLWMDITLPTFPSLEISQKAGVCIIGAGIAGLTCAYKLLKESKSVIVIDRGEVATGETARTSAHLSWALNDSYYELAEIFDQEGVKLAAMSHAQAIDYIEQIITEEKIDCDFERLDGYLFLSPNDSADVLEKEYAAIQKIGMEIEKIYHPTFGAALRFPKQGQFHVLKYLKGLIEAILRMDGKIYSNTKATQIKDGHVIANGKEIEAISIIVATATPINDRVMIHTKQAAYRTYVIAAKGTLPKGLYWDTEDPYHYIRMQGEWLIIGGEDHKTGQDEIPEERFKKLEKWARDKFTFGEVEWKWSGQVFNSQDALGFIGHNPWDKNIYIATGDSGNGITHGTIAGMLIPDLILERTNPWKDLYDPARKSLLCTKTYAEENLNTLLQYKDWFTEGEKTKVDDLALNNGIILRDGVKKLAVYKDAEGVIHVSSAVCPHLEGCVRWNSCEKSWDCPCHGSRFDAYGKVICGPANENLATGAL